MTTNSKDKMIASATQLLASRGLQATSFAEILEHSGAPRGSIYHHFPDGKDQVVASALELADGSMEAMFDRWPGKSVEEITVAVLGIWRVILERSEFGAGCAVVAVTVATDSPDLLSQAAEIFRRWRERLAALFVEAGAKKKASARFAATLVAASEGAVVMSRAEQSFEPFDLVAEQLRRQAAAL
jgi:TetR/AcrR family transcriptional repressor of lmrAB and yxaGH operons